MYTMHEPVVGSWYANRTGKLMKVRLLSYQHETVTAVMIEYLDGTRQVIDSDAWNCLELHRDLRTVAKDLVSQ